MNKNIHNDCRYIIYARKSQEDEWKQIRSIKDQIDECLRIAEIEQLKIIGTSKFLNGIVEESASARKPDNRPLFTDIIKELKKPKEKRLFDWILSWHPNRLSRNAFESWIIIQMIDDDETINLKFCSYIFHNDPSGKEHLAFEFARAKWYSDHLSVDITRWMYKRYKEWALLHQPPFWYEKKMEIKNKPEQCSLLPVPKKWEFESIQEAFRLKLQWKTDDYIAKTTFLWVKWKRWWTIDWKRLAEYFKNTFYYWVNVINSRPEPTTIDFREIERPDWEFEPVISEKDFNIINRHLIKWEPKKPEPSPRNKHWFPLGKWFIVCNHCWKNMGAEAPKATTVDTKYAQYRCKNSECPKKQTINPTWNNIRLDKVFDVIEKDLKKYFILTDRQYEQFIQYIQDYHSQEQVKIEKEKKRLQWCLAVANSDYRDIVMDRNKAERRNASSKELSILDSRKQELENEIKNIEQCLNDLNKDYRIYKDTQIKFVELGSNLYKRWFLSNFEEKQKLAEIFLSNCRIENNEIVDIVYAEPFQITKKELLKSSSNQNSYNGGA